MFTFLFIFITTSIVITPKLHTFYLFIFDIFQTLFLLLTLSQVSPFPPTLPPAITTLLSVSMGYACVFFG